MIEVISVVEVIEVISVVEEGPTGTTGHVVGRMRSRQIQVLSANLESWNLHCYKCLVKLWRLLAKMTA